MPKEGTRLINKTNSTVKSRIETGVKKNSPETRYPQSPLIQLQRYLGNQAFQTFYASGMIQPKLKINQAGDKYEREADRVADAVMRMTDGEAFNPSHTDSNIQTKCAGCASGGQQPLTHELTYVLQESQGNPRGLQRKAKIELSEPKLEAEATWGAARAIAGAKVDVRAKAPQNSVMRTNGSGSQQYAGCATQDERDAIENAINEASGRGQQAAFQIRGVVAPGPPRRGDTGEAARQRARRVVRTIFGQDLNMEQVGDIVTEMGTKYRSSSRSFVCAPRNDPDCGNRAAYVVGNRWPVHLCRTFFNSGPEEQIRTMVHEAAHLSGIGEARGETYCPIFDCDTSCGGFHVADSWSHLVHCLSGQTPDQPEEVTGAAP